MAEKMTEQDIKKIKEEIEYRKLVVRKEAIEAVKEARAQGDLSENFEYYAAKRDKNRNESRIRYLERILNNAQVIEDTTAEDEVGLYTQVEQLNKTALKTHGLNKNGYLYKINYFESKVGHSKLILKWKLMVPLERSMPDELF